MRRRSRTSHGSNEMRQRAVRRAPRGANPGTTDPPRCGHATPPVHHRRSWRRPCTCSGSSKYSWVCFVSSDYYKLDGTKHRLMSIHARRIQNRSWSRERPNM